MPRQNHEGYVCSVCGITYDEESKAKECEERGHHKSFDYKPGDYVAIGYYTNRSIVKVVSTEEPIGTHVTEVHTENMSGWVSQWNDHPLYPDDSAGPFLHPLTMEELGWPVYLLRLLKKEKDCRYVSGGFVTYGSLQDKALLYVTSAVIRNDIKTLCCRKFDTNATCEIYLTQEERRKLYQPSVENTKKFVRAALKQVREHDGST